MLSFFLQVFLQKDSCFTEIVNENFFPGVFQKGGGKNIAAISCALLGYHLLEISLSYGTLGFCPPYEQSSDKNLVIFVFIFFSF